MAHRTSAALLSLAAGAGACPRFDDVANMSSAGSFDFARFAGTWYEVYSHNIPVLSTGCYCSHYHYKYDGAPAANASEEFLCNKKGYDGKLTDLHMTMAGVGANKSFPGSSLSDKFFGIVSGPYWVLDFVEGEGAGAPYQYALPYSCVAGTEVVYLFSRTSTFPDALRESWLGRLKALGVNVANVAAVPQGPQCDYKLA